MLRLCRGWIDDNPLETFERTDRAELIRRPEQVAAFDAVARPALRLALHRGLHSGQRQGNLLCRPWSRFDAEAIPLTQGRSCRRVWIARTNERCIARRNGRSRS